MAFIKIVKTPLGAADEKIRKEWVGLVIKLASEPEQRPGTETYVVRGEDAIEALFDNNKSVAANHWRTPKTPPYFVFSKDCCEFFPTFGQEHIKVGTLLWYSGSTSMWSWDCPAIVSKVHSKTKQFQVRSLDDMKEQHQRYAIDPNKDHSSSRHNMRVTSPEEVAAYLQKRLRRSEATLDAANRELERAKENYQYFQDELKKLPPEVLNLLKEPA